VIQGVMMDYSDYANAMQAATFSGWLRSQAGPLWDRMVRHRFTLDVASDRLPPDVWRRYLLYEHAFVETAVTIFGYALVKAPSIDAQVRLSTVLHELTTDQIEYFDRAFERLGVTPAERRLASPPAAVHAFRDGMLALAAHGTYEEIIGGMAAAEWMYLTWCTAAHERSPGDAMIVDWVALHVDQPFANQVAWMRGQLDGYGPELPQRHQEAVAKAFRHTLALEIGFHHAPYLDGGPSEDPESEDA
jgi:thiaminase (transcriptional activator TenA)